MPAMPRRVVPGLLVALAGAAGSLDVLCVARLGGPFASVITGNLIQAGGAATGLNHALAVTAAVAVASYAAGVAGGSLALRRQPAGWHARTSAVGVAELILVVGVEIGWLVADGRPGTGLARVLLALAAGAMGVQSALTLSTGLGGVSTTYLTGTLTVLVRGVVARPRARTDVAGLARLLALLAGAVAGGIVLQVAPLWTPVVPAVLIAATIVIAGSFARR